METTKHSLRSGDNKSKLDMADIGRKEVTRRRAVAQGKIRMSQAAFDALRNGKNPKGDVLAVAEVAGITTAKKTSELIPLCHPLPLDKVKVTFELNPEGFEVTTFCEVITHAKTGVEMEALSGVSGALLCVYDLCKAVDPNLTLTDIRLIQKEGGKHGTWVHPEQSESMGPTLNSFPLQNIRCSILTVSDRAFRGEYEDLSGPEIQQFLSSRGAEIAGHDLVPDEKTEIMRAILHSIRDEKAELVITTGGTGLGPRDVTPEALVEIADKIIPGIGESLRYSGLQHTRQSWLSRSQGAVVENSLVITLPGSQKACREGLEALESLLPHALHVIKSGKH
jgi:cyclic pyranopterin monophosphate synthase